MTALTPSTFEVHSQEWLEQNYSPYCPPGATSARGHGKHGAVSEYVQTNTGMPVALKTQPHRFYHNESEWRTQIAVDSPYVTKVYACADLPATLGSSGVLYTVMELGEQSLADYLKGQTPTLDEAKRLFVQILQGLEACHAQDIYHRDVKAANMVLVNGTVKLVDFGKAMQVAPGTEARTFEDRDIRRACAIFCQMLPPEEAHEFRAWYETRPHLSASKVEHHPLLAPTVGVEAWPVKTPKAFATAFAKFGRAFVNGFTALKH